MAEDVILQIDNATVSNRAVEGACRNGLGHVNKLPIVIGKVNTVVPRSNGGQMLLAIAGYTMLSIACLKCCYKANKHVDVCIERCADL